MFKSKLKKNDLATHSSNMEFKHEGLLEVWEDYIKVSLYPKPTIERNTSLPQSFEMSTLGKFSLETTLGSNCILLFL